jgi:L-ascorbate metabolism protein UlaG (beta-lactamase superfamily)
MTDTPPRASVGYVGHSTVLVDLAGVRLLTDPLLRNRVTHLRRAVKLNHASLRGVDVVLISHLHYDHLDLPSLQRLGTPTTTRGACRSASRPTRWGS